MRIGSIFLCCVFLRCVFKNILVTSVYFSEVKQGLYFPMNSIKYHIIE